MSDLRNRLQAKFEPQHRHANFGEALVRMHIAGFRCHTNIQIDLESPITAFCGLNGTGKSTILQLAAVAYRAPAGRPYYVKNFLVVGQLDPTPFSTDAFVEYRYWQDNRTARIVTVSRRPTTQRWSGYPRRPFRNVLFAGVGLYLPRIEQRDFVVRMAHRLNIDSSAAVNDRVREWTCQVLGCAYENVMTHQVRYSESRGTVMSVCRSGTEYSETHMGFGEGRAQYLIQALETISEKSLILIEEPETSLHPSAQHAFAQYLVNVSYQRGHQILLTTHSEFILQALPSDSRIYISRNASHTTCIPGLTALQAKSLMTQGSTKALVILVEDACAKAALCEVLRRIDKEFLSTVGVYVGGDANTIAKTVRSLAGTGLAVAAVRDADQSATPSENIFTLPGSRPPEREIFDCLGVRNFIRQEYGIDVADFLAGVSQSDHHEWFNKLGERLNKNPDALLDEMARAWARTLPEGEAAPLCALLKESSRR